MSDRKGSIVLNTPIYLDNAATTAVCPEAAAAFLAAAQQFGNPSSLHQFGFAAERLVTEARSAIAAGLGAEPGELLFTPGGTFADNLAISGVAHRYGRRAGNGCRGHIITSAIEHDAVRNTVAALEKEGFEATFLSPDASGHVSAEDVAAAVRSDTILVSLMLVNNELGTLQPVAEAVRLVRRIRPEILFHTDAVQAYRKIRVNVRSLGVDLLSVSGHKIHAYKGIGALYLRKGVRLAPLIYGGGQERGLIPGTEPVPLIAALAAAAARPLEAEKLDALRNRVLTSVAAACPQAEVLSAGEAGGICMLTLRGLRGETVMHALAERGIYVSTGSACGRGRPSHVLSAMPIDADAAAGALRISVSQETQPEEIDRFAQALAEVADALTPRSRRS